MANINWDTVATAAVTAVVVTLLVEYAAKPRLEARKERIVAAVRTRRELVELLVSIGVTAQHLGHELPAGREPEVVSIVRKQRARNYEQMETAIMRVFDDIGRYAAVYPARLQEVLSAYLGCVVGVVISRRSQHAQARIVADFAPLITTAMQPPRLWRVRGWVRSVDAVQAMVRQVEQDSEETAAAARTVIAAQR